MHKRLLLSAVSPLAVLRSMPPMPRSQAAWMQMVCGKIIQGML